MKRHMKLFNMAYSNIDNEWILLYLTGTGIFFTLTLSFVLLLILFKKKKQQFFHEKKLMQEQFKMELVKTEMAVKEENSKQIARELHDNIGQLANKLKMYQNYLSKKAKNIPSEVMVEWDETLKQLISEIRSITSDLNGVEILRNGLSSAIHKDINSKIKISDIQFEVDFNYALEIDPDKSIFVFRIYQEALNNIIKHSKATEVTIKLDKEDSMAILTICDNGIGFDLNNQNTQGSGLKHIKERVDLIQSTVEFKSRPDFEGTCIKISIPCQ